jgi:hypothetical protein
MVQMWKHRDALVNVNAIEIVGNDLKQKRHSLPESEAANCSSDAVKSSQFSNNTHLHRSFLPEMSAFTVSTSSGEMSWLRYFFTMSSNIISEACS